MKNLIFLLLVFAVDSGVAAPSCRIFEKKLISEDKITQSQVVDSGLGRQILGEYTNLVRQNSRIQSLIPVKAINDFLTASEPLFFEELFQFLGALRSGENTDAALKSIWEYKWPSLDVKARLAAYKRSRKTSEDLRWLVGEMSLDEVQEMVYGRNPLQPSKDSLLGRFISETGAATVVRTFAKTATGRSKGKSKLVVAISQSSFNKYVEMFSRPEFTKHVHTPHQGTLAVEFNGRYHNYVSSSEFRLPQLGSLLPMIIMSSTEGARADRYFQFFERERENAKNPWNLVDEKDRTYCARGGYQNCTHWFMQLPVGDKEVRSYTFPGSVDAYGDGQGKSSRRGSLSAHNGGDFAKEVWTAPGHEMLADLVGLRSSHLRGELANPGWLLITLTGVAKNDRVPVVFYVTSDHQQKIPSNFETQASPQ